ncbi:MAG: hypothetical protein ACP5Q4_03880 [Candidatus Caldatribacteriaceae bacterium]
MNKLFVRLCAYGENGAEIRRSGMERARAPSPWLSVEREISLWSFQ